MTYFHLFRSQGSPVLEGSTNSLIQDCLNHTGSHHKSVGSNTNLGSTMESGLGRGSQGSFGHGFFIKFLRTTYGSERIELSEKLSELNLTLQRLKNPNLLPSFFLESRFFLDSAPFIITPWLKQGNIQSYLERNPDADRLLKICTVADALCYLHCNEVVHGDLKPSNILVDDSGSPVIADFGLSHIIDPCNHNEGLGSARYATPELMDGSVGSRTYQSDVYTFASVSAEILTGIKPFCYTLSDVDVVLALYDRDSPYSPPEYSLLGHPEPDQAFWDLMTGCWNGEPERRPSKNQWAAHESSM